MFDTCGAPIDCSAPSSSESWGCSIAGSSGVPPVVGSCAHRGPCLAHTHSAATLHHSGQSPATARLVVMGNVAGGRGCRGVKHGSARFVVGIVSPRTPWRAGQELPSAAEDRAGWRASAPDLLRHMQACCMGAVVQPPRRPPEDQSDTEARSLPLKAVQHSMPRDGKIRARLGDMGTCQQRPAPRPFRWLWYFGDPLIPLCPEGFAHPTATQSYRPKSARSTGALVGALGMRRCSVAPVGV